MCIYIYFCICILHYTLDTDYLELVGLFQNRVFLEKKCVLSKLKKKAFFGKRPTNVWVLDALRTNKISVYHIAYIIYHASYTSILYRISL